jgi:hypothetical protein
VSAAIHDCRASAFSITTSLKDAESRSDRPKTKLTAQSKKTADDGVRDFNIFLFQRQNKSTETINQERRQHRVGSVQQQKNITK